MQFKKNISFTSFSQLNLFYIPLGAQVSALQRQKKPDPKSAEMVKLKKILDASHRAAYSEHLLAEE